MLEVSKNDIIKKILFLERNLGRYVNYKILSPFSVLPNDILSIQSAVKHISNFVGLNKILFIVGIAKQSENTAGKIDLDNKYESFIEIDSNVANDPNAILHVLSHEISHKYLKYYGIHQKEGIIYEKENEILTDLTAIYLGLGKLILNGCDRINYHETKEENKVTRHTTKHNYGYLSQENYAFAYNIVCFMRNIPESIKYSGLGYGIDRLVQVNYRENNSEYFDESLHNPDKSWEIHYNLKNENIMTQQLLVEFEKIYKIINKFNSKVGLILSNNHKFINSSYLSSKSHLNNNEVNRVICVLDKILQNYEYVKIKNEQCEQRRKLQIDLKILEKYIIKIFEYENRCKGQNDYFEQIICYNCGFKKEVAQKIEGKVIKCPKCGYEFYNDNTFPVIKYTSEEKVSVNKEKVLEKKESVSISKEEASVNFKNDTKNKGFWGKLFNKKNRMNS